MQVVDSSRVAHTLSRAASRPVILVPTMGALHEGHAELISHARAEAGPDGTVVVSVFVNPTQFGPGEDFDSYPRALDQDQKICEERGADLIFAPSASEIYSDNASMKVEESTLSQTLCGQSRPTHFAGVCLIVLKLFNIVAPDRAVFGKKDYQQLAIIRRMVRDLNLEIEIIGAETVREIDGLAMSSRNALLTPNERTEAAGIRHALIEVLSAVQSGTAAASELQTLLRDTIQAKIPLGKIDYAEIVDAVSLGPIAQVEKLALAAVAVQFSRTRLIDNIELLPPSRKS